MSIGTGIAWNLSLVASFTAIAAIAPASGQTNRAELRTGGATERSISGGQKHTYVVRLKKGQLAHFVADQRGVDVVVRVFGPNGTPVGTFDSPNGDRGPEPATIIAESSGVYRFDIAPLLSDAAAGKYLAKLVDVRAATRSEMEEAQTVAEVKQADAAWENAVGKADAVALATLISDGYRNLESGARPGKRAWVENQKTTAKPQPPKEIDLLQIHSFGDVAIAASRVTFKRPIEGREVRDSIRAIHVWKKEGGRWQIVGDLTYHAGDTTPHTAVRVDPDVLRSCAGKYILAPVGVVSVTPNGERLTVEANTGKAELLPESESDFFTRGGDLVVTFVRNAKGEVTHALFVANGRAARALRIN